MNLRSALLSLTLLSSLSSFAGAQAARGEPANQATLEAERQRQVAEREAHVARLLKEKWQVRTNLLMVSVPQPIALELLPSLRDGSKIEATSQRLVQMIARKEARLIAWPEVVTQSGQRALTEGILEERYATEFGLRKAADGFRPPAKPDSADLAPTAFETRNTGTTLEVEAVVAPDGGSILVSLVPQHVALAEMKTHFTGKNSAGADIRLDQPQFRTMKTTVSVRLLSGQQLLLATFEDHTANALVFFIVQAEILPGGN
ncbi:MAG TPA: hypothetical protein VGO90_15985 [Chthoniobacteraceae bacterium]|jgi:hypothetical protein|nr:hypothetical protein [Chthoniobacteraceae bacterium]